MEGPVVAVSSGGAPRETPVGFGRVGARRSVESALGVSLTCQPRLEVESVSETNRFDGRRGGGDGGQLSSGQQRQKEMLVGVWKTVKLDSGRKINSGFVLEVPPSVMMPSHCRREGLVWVWDMEGREGRDESESHRCRAARRAAQGGRWAAERTSTPPPPRLGTGVCWRRTRLAR